MGPIGLAGKYRRYGNAEQSGSRVQKDWLFGSMLRKRLILLFASSNSYSWFCSGLIVGLLDGFAFQTDRVVQGGGLSCTCLIIKLGN